MVNTLLPAASFTTAPAGDTLKTTIFGQLVGYPTVLTLIAGTFLPGMAGAALPPLRLSPSTTVLVLVCAVCDAEQPAVTIEITTATAVERARALSCTRTMLRIAPLAVRSDSIESMAGFARPLSRRTRL